MSNGKGYALVIVSLIIGATGLGMGIYSALNFAVVEGPQGDPGVDGFDGINGTLNNIVGVWESISGGPAYNFALNFSDPQLTEPGFFTLDMGNVGWNITFSKAGWYRFNIKFKWDDLTSTSDYSIQINKVYSGQQIIVSLKNPTVTEYLVDTHAYVYCDVGESYNVGCVNLAVSDTTYISSMQFYNQFVLEYVKEA